MATADFRRIYREGARGHGQHMVVFALFRSVPPPHARFGVTASKKVGGAVVRSRVKRRLRELVRSQLSAAVGGRPVDVVVNARRGLDRAPWPDLLDDFRRCLQQAVARAERATRDEGREVER